jgi:hypothetical protein
MVLSSVYLTVSARFVHCDVRLHCMLWLFLIRSSRLPSHCWSQRSGFRSLAGIFWYKEHSLIRRRMIILCAVLQKASVNHLPCRFYVAPEFFREFTGVPTLKTVSWRRTNRLLLSFIQWVTETLSNQPSQIFFNLYVMVYSNNNFNS